ncbi:MAG: hypothetical protein GWN00_01470 [Aliifodinibius sp.]|nr:hypothetical protein [Phycisphaerae bacterium]NIR62348.1 hypothetical protein [candidate division Zixibacteria bacterium]NIT54948.1 hypothetical protein [Fodinibius sp.]NIW43360.1 hypothetical protein [Gammaproteobacteria bacterium]NIU12582.1 hypothetical protein [candidate division Zixibacteria bacterium]
MLIREIADNPDKVLTNFDWFNDYNDTRSWAAKNCPGLVPRLDAGHKKWMADAKKRLNDYYEP